MRLEDIHTIVVHTTATRPSTSFGIKECLVAHKARGFRREGYHAIIRRMGLVESGRPCTMQGAHVRGNNRNTLGVSMEGGLNEQSGKPEDNFTPAQYDALQTWIKRRLIECPNVTKICGHRDFSPDLDGNGVIEEFEWTKQCPCFDVATKLTEWGYGSVEEMRAAALAEKASGTL